MHYTYELFLKELGARLKQLRKDRGWSLRTMVVDHNFHITHWQGFESGKAISVPSLLKIAEVFDMPLEDIVRGLGRPEPSELTASSAEAADSAMPQTASRAGRPKKLSSRPTKA